MTLQNHVYSDMLGTRYGSLVVLGFEEKSSSGHILVLCSCDCGNTIVRQASKVRNGNNKSCGCLKYRSGNESHRWTGYKEISGYVWSGFRTSARKRNIPFNISIEDGWDLFIAQDRKCVFSGVRLKFSDKNENWKDTTASLDRINSSLEYTLSNIQWVHKELNQMKSARSDEDFIAWCTLVANHQGAL